MSNQDFLSRVESVRKQIDSLSNQISSIASAHQRAISSPDGSSSTQVEHLVSQTQILNTQIKDQIKYLEKDAAQSGRNVTKDSQIRNLKTQFKSRLEQYQQEESQYKKRYQEQIARQYKIVNPEASEEEVREASQANWGDEGVFQTAVSAHDPSVHPLTQGTQHPTYTYTYTFSLACPTTDKSPSSDLTALAPQIPSSALFVPATTISKRSNKPSSN